MVGRSLYLMVGDVCARLEQEYRPVVEGWQVHADGYHEYSMTGVVVDPDRLRSES